MSRNFYAVIQEHNGFSYVMQVSTSENLAKKGIESFFSFTLCESKKKAEEIARAWNHMERISNYRKHMDDVREEARSRKGWNDSTVFALAIDSEGDMEYVVYDTKSVFKTFPKTRGSWIPKEYENAARYYNSLVTDEDCIPLF